MAMIDKNSRMVEAKKDYLLQWISDRFTEKVSQNPYIGIFSTPEPGYLYHGPVFINSFYVEKDEIQSQVRILAKFEETMSERKLPDYQEILVFRIKVVEVNAKFSEIIDDYYPLTFARDITEPLFLEFWKEVDKKAEIVSGNTKPLELKITDGQLGNTDTFPKSENKGISSKNKPESDKRENLTQKWNSFSDETKDTFRKIARIYRDMEREAHKDFRNGKSNNLHNISINDLQDKLRFLISQKKITKVPLGSSRLYEFKALYDKGIIE